MSFLRRSLALLLLSFSSFAKPALAETWKIITLDWPPYTDEQRADKGAAARALAAALKAVGVDVEFVFMPWSRGAYEVKKAEYVGIFPTWTEKIFKEAALSPPIFKSPVGFAYSRSHPYPWKTLQDFKGLRMGVVRDYNYPNEIQSLSRAGVFSLHVVNTDEQNLFKVAYNRVNVTIVDLTNARYLIQFRNPELKNLVTVDPKVYKNAELFIALKKDAKFAERTAKLKRALEKVSAQKMVDESVLKILK